MDDEYKRCGTANIFLCVEPLTGETIVEATNRRTKIDFAHFGSFIVDFYCPAAQLVIEIDGGQHYEEDGRIRDGLRDDSLQRLGLRVLRFSNLDVLKNMDGVIAAIVEYLETVFDPAKTNS